MSKWQAELAENRGMFAGTDMNCRPKPWKKKCKFFKADVVGKLHMVLSDGVYIDTKSYAELKSSFHDIIGIPS